MNSEPIRRTGSALGARQLAVVIFLAMAAVSEARDFRVNQIPNGSRFRCLNCHVSSGGGGTRTAFGQAVNALVRPGQSTPFWSATLAALDSDGDGATNGEELGDPEGDGTPTAGATVTNPGNATSKPPANVAPQVAISAPATGTTRVAPGVVTIEVNATDADGKVAKVEILSGDRLLGVDSEAPFSLVVDLDPGTHTITAKATDDKGATATSQAILATVNPPAATMITRVTSGVGTMAIEWTAGGGPYQVQSKAAMMDPWCAASDVTLGLSATIPASGDSAMMRVADLAIGPAASLSVVLGGAFERPTPIVTGGSGSGFLKLEGNTLTFDVSYQGLSGPATLAHIHGVAGTDGTAGVLVDLAPFNGGAFGVSGKLAGKVVVTTEQKAAILSGKTYVNIHTDANKPGEIRGQIVPMAMGAALSGFQEAPTPVVSAGRGSGHFTLSGDQLSFVINYTGLSGAATLAHIHGPAAAGVSAGVLIDLAPFHDGALAEAGRFVGTVTLTPEQLVAVVSGLTYVNVHTALNRPGEIRGQILPCVSGKPLNAQLSGEAENPAVTTSGVGRAILRLEGNTLSFDVRYGGLSGPATLAHIHGPAGPTENAGVMVDLAPYHVGTFGVSGAFTGSVVLTPAQKAAVLSGQTYVNIHTAANKPGEIRGQVVGVGLP